MAREDSNEGVRCCACDRLYGPTDSEEPCPYCEIERLRAELTKWHQTAQGPNCSGLEQLNGILAGLVREYGCRGELILSRDFSHEVPLGQQIRWSCTGHTDDYIVIREVESEAAKPEEGE